ncbi:formylglycine-generating enzyme family protein [Streptomyces luteolus]|uniref:Formylglycine-generating enzyme family protein n=1 Tax=Streptomyces luteolus TaxID=3043615 RepID=A0ABT6SZS7_9ACTN|nr:formylglycine-generating enzyme family protein [Streptomyces sp. B-S-A12]MDI3421113.1 formylglycine-generating enzyme family protein [Streptomyces sp. B-S-A12]
MTACCAPRRQPGTEATGAPAPVTGTGAARSRAPHGGWAVLSGGTFLMGSDSSPYPEDREGPAREVTVDGFAIAATAVTNAEFAAFVAATGYVTDAERFGWSFVFGGFLPDDFPPTAAAAATPWWRQVFGAAWNHPEGPRTTLADRQDHPVVHVSYDDALAYCRWAGARLPAEAEWEYAARGGLDGKPYPWGEERDPGGAYRMNIFRGSFPHRNTAADGYRSTCPVDAFEPNAHGLFNTTGNVWEWCADRFTPGTRVLKGGSHLCHESYCLRYRTSARMGNTPDSSSGNTGFRVVRAG